VTDNHQNENLHSRVRAVWCRGQLLHVTAGMLAFCRWAVLLFLAGMAIDWMTRMPMPGRVAILATLLAVSLYKAWRCGWRQVRAFNATHTVLRIEEHVGGLESLLVSAVQFQNAGLCAGTSESLREVTCRKAAEAVAPLRPKEIVRYHGLRRPLTILLLLALVIGSFVVANGPLLIAGAGRIFAPWLAISYPIRTHLDMGTGDMIVKEGDKVQIKASVWGIVPREAELALRTGTGNPRLHELEITDGNCEYTVATAFRGFEYRIIAGDSSSDWHSVEVISSPRIEKAEVELRFPPYTKRPTETVEALTITVPEQSTVKWKLTLDRAVSKADFNPASGDVQPLEISDDGRTVTMQQVVTQSRSYNFSWVERDHNFSFKSSSHYLQVSPDRAPRVELTSPKSNLYATLGRKIDLAFRGRDDHGIGKSVIAYRLNKAEEEKVDFTAPKLSEGGETRIDWDYRTVLPKLAIGDSVLFVVELADRYPGPNGPHRARSQARRITFLSREDYLKHIAKQKHRLHSKLMAIYREERRVHEVVSSLDPAGDVFVQSCQLEAVRQDMMRKRLNVLKERIHDLIDDMAANNVEDETGSAALAKLGNNLQIIADDHVGRAASLLRDLAAATTGGTSDRNPVAAVDMVNSSARELGLLVFQIGFAEGADAMARELHATVQTQVGLRQRTVAGGKAEAAGGGDPAAAQTRLAEETARLLAATPRNKESTSADALVAFKLSRMVNRLLRSGTVDKMNESAALIAKGESEQAACLQTEVISALLHAEFRLRPGAEYEALTKARNLLVEQADGQKKLREKVTVLSKKEFSGNQTAIAESQAAIHQQFQSLLMPEVPANRPSLFDVVYPAAPPVGDLLAKGSSGFKAAVTAIEAGDREAAATHQQQVETALASLAEIASRRIEAMSEEARIVALVTISTKQASQILALEERLIALLEQAEDAADEEVDTAFLVPENQALADDAGMFLRNIGPGDDNLPLFDCVGRVARALTKATPLLKENKPDAAIHFQEQALDSLGEAGGVIEELTETRTAFAEVLATARDALAPSPLLAEIEAEQAVLAAATAKTKDAPAGRAELVIPQKNLVHAVNAVLDSLDALAHRIDSGTVLAFAKEDMEAAATGLETGDIEDSLDAQSVIVESLQELQAKLEEVTPRYRYVRELTECQYELMLENAAILTGIRQLKEQAEGAPDVDLLKRRAEEFGSQLKRLSGEKRHAATAGRLVQAIGDKGAEAALKESLDTMRAEASEQQTLIKNLAYLIAPPVSTGYGSEPEPEIALLEKVLDLAAHQQDLSRNTQSAVQDELAATAERQRELAAQCRDAGPHPKLATAHIHTEAAAAALEASDRATASTSQHQANDALRHFVYEYTLKYVKIPPPGPPEDPAPKDEEELTEVLSLFEPGALTGDKPKGGRPEWDVLGRRDRAALNENFARELPLEYREILKDYYERLTHDP